MEYLFTEEQGNAIMSDMTVCIAAIAEGGKKIIAGTDTMLSYPIGNGVNYQMENPTHDKLQMITKGVAVMGAGNTDTIKVIIDGARNTVTEKDRPIEVAEKIRKSYEKVLHDSQERSILSPAGLNWDSYTKHQNQLQPDIVKDLHVKLQAHNLGTEMVVAGFDSTSETGYVAAIGGPGATLYDKNTLGNAICGALFITNHFFAQSGYHKNMTEKEVRDLVEAAIKEAGHTPGVGGVGKIISLPS